jgi:CRISPR-associated endonuclease/helicase Cas3
LEGLHYGGDSTASEEDLDAVVRDGDRGVEVVLVHRVPGGYTALDGTRLGVQGEVLDDPVVERLLGGSVRLPAGLVEDEARLSGLSGWVDHPWLRHARALVLEEGWAQLDGWRVSYHSELGLVVESF